MPADLGRNVILARLSDSDRDVVARLIEHIPLAIGTTLHEFTAPTERYLFPLAGMVSLTVPTPGGENVEVALVGREGVVGISDLLGHPRADLEAIAQHAGSALSLPKAAVTPALLAGLRTAVDSYAAMLLIELAQTAACNRVHTVEQRTARWLLHAADRAETADLQLTHEFLAMMLGVRRASVTVVVGGFEAAGLIEAKRKRISVADREGLLKYACTCYEILRQATAIDQPRDRPPA